jgi:hypothetical protein
MKVLELNQIQRAEEGLYYRRKFTAVAVIQIPLSNLKIPISFTIETGPLGNKDLSIDFFSSLDYPVIPLKKALAETIMIMDSEGRLP